MLKFRQKALSALSLGMIIIILDQFSKFAALKYLVFQQPVEINRFFNLYLDFNTGAAFSFLKSEGGWQVWIFGFIALFISLGIIIYLFKNKNISGVGRLALAFILGGAMGNLIDRVLYQHVIDFMSVHINNHYWPTFNIADSAICIGVFLLLFSRSD